MDQRDQPWEQIAGVAVTALTVVTAADGGAVVFAATTAGVFRSDDAGRSWAATGSGVALADAVVALPAFGPTETLFVGAHDGLYYSGDGGRHWERRLFGSAIPALALGTDDAGLNILLVGSDSDGVLRSDDAGRTWTSGNPGLRDRNVASLALSPAFARDGTAFAATATRLYRSRSGGKAWRPVVLPPQSAAVQCLAVSPAFARDRLALAGTEADGLLRSRDGGETWETVRPLDGHGVLAVAFAPGSITTPSVAVATETQVWRSRDGGETWQPSDALPAPALSLLYVPDGGGLALLAGLHEGGVGRLAGD